MNNEYNVNSCVLPGFAMGEFVNLFLEVDHDLLVLLLEQVSGLLRLQVYIFKKLAKFGQFGITFSVDLELKNLKTIQIVLPKNLTGNIFDDYYC